MMMMMMMMMIMMLNLIKSSRSFEAGKGREGLFTNKDLNEQYDACNILFRYFHPVEFYEIWCGFDNSLTHMAKSPDGLDAIKLNKSDGGANVEKQRDGWYDTVINGILTRTVQKMQNASGVQLGLLSILKERGKHRQKKFHCELNLIEMIWVWT